MICSMLRVSEEKLKAFLQDSSLLEAFLNEIYEDDETENDSLFSLDKSWDALIYLWTGSTFNDAPKDSLSRVIFSTNLIDKEQDLGMGPAHYLSPTEVKKYAKELSILDINILRSNYNADKMNDLDVYPGYWEEEEAYKDFLIDTFQELLLFINTAAANEEALISYLS